MYCLDGYEDYYYGYMASSTGILKTYDLFVYDDGFVLQLPVRQKPEQVPEFAPPAKLFNVMKESTQWAEMLDVSTVGALNEHVANDDIGSFILVQEALLRRRKYLK